MVMLFITNLNMFIFEFLLTRYPQLTEACRARNGFSKRFVMIGIVFVIGIGYFVTGTWGQKKGGRFGRRGDVGSPNASEVEPPSCRRRTIDVGIGEGLEKPGPSVLARFRHRRSREF